MRILWQILSVLLAVALVIILARRMKDKTAMLGIRAVAGKWDNLLFGGECGSPLSRIQLLLAALLFLATVALLIPSAVGEADSGVGTGFTQKLSMALAVLLLEAHGWECLFSLKTHRELFASPESGESNEPVLPISVALATPVGERDLCRFGRQRSYSG